MSRPAENLSSLPTLAVRSDPGSVLRIVEDALSDEHSPINNIKHPWHREAVKALRRLQLQLMDPSHPTISELDLKRLNISQYKAQEIKDNIRFKGSAIGDRLPKREYFVGWYEDSGQPKYTWMTKPEWEVFCDENTEDDSDDDWDW